MYVAFAGLALWLGYPFVDDILLARETALAAEEAPADDADDAALHVATAAVAGSAAEDEDADLTRRGDDAGGVPQPAANAEGWPFPTGAVIRARWRFERRNVDEKTVERGGLVVVAGRGADPGWFLVLPPEGPRSPDAALLVPGNFFEFVSKT